MARGSQTFGDMARSLGLMLLVIVVLLAIGPARALIFPGADRRPATDPTEVTTGFTTATGLTPALPTGLPSGWTPNGASLEHTAALGEHLHVGWVTPASHYLGVDEATGSASALVRSVAGKRALTVTGSTDAPGEHWDVRVSDRGEQVYTSTFGRITVLVTGDATPDEFDLALRAISS
jgi:hypothetical protein